MAKQEFITIDASAMEGVDYATYLADYFANQGTTPADPFEGDVKYYGSTYFANVFGYYDGSQVGITYQDSTDQGQVLIEGANMQYDGVASIHGSYSGSVDAVNFGFWDENTEFLENGTERSTLIGMIKELKISGLGIFEEVGAGMGADNDYHQLLNALRHAVSDEVEEGQTLSVGELAIQKLYQMFASKAQHFIGSEGDDTYVGTKFADKIDGGAGTDTLTGGKGKDLFLFDLDDSSAVLEDADTILGFNTKQDRIDLRLIDTNAEKDGDQAFKFLGTGEFTGKAGQMNYERVDGQTLVHLDIDGNSEADMTIILQGSFKLAADDFLL